MKKIQSLIIIPFVIMGCQSALQNHSNVADPGITMIEQETPFESPTSRRGHTHDPIIATGTAGKRTDSIRNSLKKSPRSVAAQEKIDQALELCNSAQALWEKGELENALTELDSAYAAILDLDTNAHPLFTQQKEDIRYMISKRILEIYASRNIVVTGSHDAIPITLNAYVQKEINLLTGSERNFFIHSMKRSGRYQPFIASEFKKAGIPEELSWLPLIESGFRVRALSPARALGLWQFIPSTGYKFGLKRDYYVDERLDPVKSTHAAIAYLKELHGMFGDWATVLAAYNCGEGRVLRIIRQQNINYLDNFWDLYEKLPRETSRYVPRFLATIHILKNLDQFKFDATCPAEPFEFEICTVNKQLRLKDIAREIQVEPSLLKDLNPELRYALLPPEEYEVRIPAEKAGLFLAKLDSINSSFTPPTRYAYHKVRKGETLSGIAKRYHTSIHQLTLINKISKKTVIVSGKVLKVPNSDTTPTQKTAHGIAATPPSQTVKYMVRQGDNLWLIAGRYKTTTKAIMAANNLRSSALTIGQELKIPAKKTSTQRISTHFVKSGDNPFTIAKKYNMTLHRLLSLNHLTSRSKIYPGQKLLVE
ncbi:MltD2 [Desulforapulum autotrophicum HRM2]|uniref:MltD2 n=2 Tax=Desulforapulum autotrophicum TaxID=2296 RepID=C0Q9Y9_DESAH|nr:MltD2 [Desulforapulum autotrophicum HRM2]